jgi:hypothetical protein
MRRHEIWLALGVFSTTGLVFAYVAQDDGRFEYAPEIVVVAVALLGLGISFLTFLVWLKR